MLAIGRALMTDPVLLALDEPSLGLAPLIIDRIYEVIARLRDEMKMTVLLVEQNAQRALDIADYAYILENGRVVLDGTAQKLASNADVQEFYLGVSESGARACATSSTTSGARGGCHDRAAQRRKPQQELWRPQGRRRCQLTVTAGRDLQRDRPERRRQDHAVQHDQRRAAADRRPHPVRRHRSRDRVAVALRAQSGSAAPSRTWRCSSTAPWSRTCWSAATPICAPTCSMP